MFIKDVMTSSPFCCDPSDRVDRVAELMVKHDCGAIPVCAGRKLVGMITDRDITCRVVATGKTPASTLVSEVMTTHVHAIGQDEDVEEAIELMKTKLVRRLPVLNGAGEIVGIVAPSDLAPTMASHHVADFLLAVSYWNHRAAAT
jgi:CBS domain-containing protein